MPRKKKLEEAPEKTETTKIDLPQDYDQTLEELKSHIREYQVKTKANTPSKKKKEEIPETENPKLDLQQDYAQIIEELKRQIRESQLRAALAATKEVVHMYWTIGAAISEQEKQGASGANIIAKMSKDFLAVYPGYSIGFSKQNLLYMKKLYESYPDDEITQLPVAQIPWKHNMILLEKLDNPAERLWYAVKILENGWGVSTLETQIENDLYNNQTKKKKTGKTRQREEKE